MNILHTSLQQRLSATDRVGKLESIKRWVKVEFSQTALCDIMQPPHSFELDLSVAQRGVDTRGPVKNMQGHPSQKYNLAQLLQPSVQP